MMRAEAMWLRSLIDNPEVFGNPNQVTFKMDSFGVKGFYKHNTSKSDNLGIVRVI